MRDEHAPGKGGVEWDTMTLSDVVLSLLKRRGIETPEAIEAFLAPDYAKHTHPPELLEGIDDATARILAALRGGERIAIYADFDCDGIPGAALMSDFFEKVGHRDYEVYVPHRDREGYGFHIEAIAALAERGVTLILTVDVGTNALEAVRFANEKGIDVIVTDHHEVTGELPDCVAVLNPKLGTYPFPHLCGAAMAFKLVQATLRAGKRAGRKEFEAVPEGWEKWLLDLVAIATVADMVPLVGENRTLVYWGLQVLRKTPRPGLVALVRALRLRKSDLTEDDIGFSIAPRINAASRMDEPDLALRLLTTKDPYEAEHLSARLEALNASRRGVVGSIVREAKKRVRERFTENEPVVVLGSPEWKPSLLGLAANSIVEERGGMVCLWGRDAYGRIKGSCRSDGSLSVVEVFSQTKETFVEFGGHAQSGGFTLVTESVHTFHETLAQAAAASKRADVARALSFDAHASIRELDALFRDVACLAPFGVGNPKPVFRIGAARIKEVRTFGREKNHIELSLSCLESGIEARAFDFFRSARDFTRAPQVNSVAAILATLERDTYRGGCVLRLVDVLPA